MSVGFSGSSVRAQFLGHVSFSKSATLNSPSFSGAAMASPGLMEAHRGLLKLAVLIEAYLGYRGLLKLRGLWQPIEA